MSDKSIIQLNELTSIEDTDIFHVVRDNLDYKIQFSDMEYDIKPYYEYVALISQRQPYTDTGAGGDLEVGAIYNINNYVAGDDFSNMELISGTTNTTNSAFRATSPNANDWSNGSLLSYNGDPFIVSTDYKGNLNPLVNTFPVPISYRYESTGTYRVDLVYDISKLEYYIVPNNINAAYNPFFVDFTMKNFNSEYFIVKSLLVDDDANATLINTRFNYTPIYFRGFY